MAQNDKNTGAHVKLSPKEQKKAQKEAEKAQKRAEKAQKKAAKEAKKNGYPEDFAVNATARFNGAAQGAYPMNSGTSAYMPVQPAQTQEPLPKKKIGKTVGIVLGIIVGVLAIIYAVGCIWFSGHFFPNSTFSSHDVSMESSADFATEIEDRVADYSLKVTSENGGYSLVINNKDIDMQVDPSEIASNACSNQNFWAWPYEIFQSHDVTDVVKAKFDTDKFNKIVTDSLTIYNSTATATTDATIVYNADFGMFIIQPQNYGTQIDTTRFLESLTKAVQSVSSTYVVDSNDYVQPTIESDDERLKTAMTKANQYVAGEIELTMNGTVSAGAIDKATIASFVALNENVEATLSTDAVQAYVDQKSSELNTAGGTKTWTRADGKVCTVTGGVYGWKVDTEGLNETILEQLNAFNFTAIDIPCSQTADTYVVGGRDFTAYVDVDISEQHVRYYSATDELLYECDCVTGMPTKDRATPTGSYYLRMKQSPATLVSSTKDSEGNPTYETKVTYWMPFVGNSVGLHDATWQSSFGGQRYLTNGSHGCVNLSLSDAGWFYQNLPVNTCIITHN